jgi:ribokinase
VRIAVVGHVEWIEFARVERMPQPGEIAHALETWEEVGGGGAVAAVQLARLAGECVFLTALGDDELGHRAAHELAELGVAIEVAWRPEPQRRAFVHVDDAGERTITVIGRRLGPNGEEPLPWPALAVCDAVYFTAGDASALQLARASRRLVATMRASETLTAAGVEIDAVVASVNDAGESYPPAGLDPPPLALVRTDGGAGGEVVGRDGTSTRWQPAPLPGEVVDAYGAGDCFAAGLTFGLADGMTPLEAAAVGAECGAACMTRRGPFGRHGGPA